MCLWSLGWGINRPFVMCKVSSNPARALSGCQVGLDQNCLLMVSGVHFHLPMKHGNIGHS